MLKSVFILLLAARFQPIVAELVISNDLTRGAFRPLPSLLSTGHGQLASYNGGTSLQSAGATGFNTPLLYNDFQNPSPNNHQSICSLCSLNRPYYDLEENRRFLQQENNNNVIIQKSVPSDRLGFNDISHLSGLVQGNGLSQNVYRGSSDLLNIDGGSSRRIYAGGLSPLNNEALLSQQLYSGSSSPVGFLSSPESSYVAGSSISGSSPSLSFGVSNGGRIISSVSPDSYGAGLPQGYYSGNSYSGSSSPLSFGVLNGGGRTHSLAQDSYGSDLSQGYYAGNFYSGSSSPLSFGGLNGGGSISSLSQGSYGADLSQGYYADSSLSLNNRADLAQNLYSGSYPSINVGVGVSGLPQNYHQNIYAGGVGNTASDYVTGEFSRNGPGVFFDSYGNSFSPPNFGVSSIDGGYSVGGSSQNIYSGSSPPAYFQPSSLDSDYYKDTYGNNLALNVNSGSLYKAYDGGFSQGFEGGIAGFGGALPQNIYSSGLPSGYLGAASLNAPGVSSYSNYQESGSSSESSNAVSESSKRVLGGGGNSEYNYAAQSQSQQSDYQKSQEHLNVQPRNFIAFKL